MKFDSDEDLRNIVLTAPMGICVLDAATLVSEIVNESFLEVAGKPYDAIAGKFYWDAFAEAREYYEPALNKVVEEGEAFYANEVELMLVRHGQEEIVFVTFVYSPLKDAAGKVKKVAVWVLENTLQVKARQKTEAAEQRARESEKTLKNMILQAPVAMCILTGPSHTIEVANELIIELWGKHPADLVRKPIFDALPEAKEQGLKELLDHVYSTGETIKANERRVDLIRRGKLESLYLNFVYEPYRASDNSILGVFAIATDVTEQVLARLNIEKKEIELLEIKKRLELELEAGKQLQQQKDDFIGIASHELKTPLTVLKSAMQLLSRLADKNTVSSKFQDLINVSNSSISKLNHLFEELLNDTRINEGQLELNKSSFILADMINDCCDHIRIMGTYKILTTGDLNLEVYADKQRIDQVIVNLINNAVKYAPKSKQIVVLIEKTGDMAKISVNDNGPGISPEKLPHLFKRYYRADKAGNQFSGLGLGLFISSEIIHKHNGQIGVNSELGKGSSFWFTLPLNQHAPNRPV